MSDDQHGFGGHSILGAARCASWQRGRHRLKVLIGATLLVVAGLPSAQAAAPCLFTGAELSSALRRPISDGVVTPKAGGDAYCAYADGAKSNRRIALEIQRTHARAWHDSGKRVLQMGTAKDAERAKLPGVGDDAYFNGTSAGAVAGDVAVRLGSIWRKADPAVSPEQVATLLRTALERAR